MNSCVEGKHLGKILFTKVHRKFMFVFEWDMVTRYFRSIYRTSEYIQAVTIHETS